MLGFAIQPDAGIHVINIAIVTAEQQILNSLSRDPQTFQSPRRYAVG